MPRHGSLTPRDLIGKLDILRVECPKGGRRGQYNVAKLAEQIGLDGKLTDWKSDIAADCPGSGDSADHNENAFVLTGSLPND
jgi:hypothetical protein